MSYHNRTILGYVVAFGLALLVAALAVPAHAAQGGGEGFCSVVADAAQVAANARSQGALLGQYRSKVAQLAHSNADMARLLDKVGVIVFTSEDFAGLTPEQAMRLAYRSCMSAS
ncbi:MAG: hypothetical protein P4L92_18775 [Rudaea sp.]|nr:hypothetical protein [Rudaea sp.]